MKWGKRALFIAWFFSLAVFAQGVQVYDSREGGAPASPEAAAAPSGPAVGQSAQDADDDDLEALSRELEAQNKAMGAAGAILESPDEKSSRIEEEKAQQESKAEAESGPQLNPHLLELQAALQGGRSSMDILQDPQLRKKLIAAYQNNPMVHVPREMLKEMLTEQMNKTPLAGVIKQFPKLLDFLVDFMRHPKALGQSVKILDRMDDLKRCGYVSIGLMILVFILRKKLITKRTAFMKKIGISLSTSALLLGGSLGYLWYSFSEELAPGLEVFKQTFF